MPNPPLRGLPSLLPIERPHCPKCHMGRMMLARISPSPDGADRRTFECPRCDYVHMVEVKDPLRSAETGWTHSSELKPPR